MEQLLWLWLVEPEDYPLQVSHPYQILEHRSVVLTKSHTKESSGLTQSYYPKDKVRVELA